jgi:mRNA interferase YafQ
MRSISKTKQFRKDQKRELKGVYKDTLVSDLMALIDLLIDDAPLPVAYVDHALSGEWKDCRDAHVKPDLLLIYRKVGDAKLELLRIGSHSELGL